MIDEINLNKYEKCPCNSSEQKKKDMVKKESSETGLDEANLRQEEVVGGSSCHKGQ